MGQSAQIAHDPRQRDADDVLVERGKGKGKHEPGEHGADLHATGRLGLMIFS
jgi:hypothetical protein